MNLFRKIWLVRKLKRFIQEGDMDSLMSIFGWLAKSKWAQGHRRQIGAALTVATTILTLASGPLAGVIPALAAPALHTTLLTIASYFGIVGHWFQNDPTS